MQTDKSLLPFSKSNTLIEYQYQRLCKSFETVYISSKKNKFDFLKETNSVIYDTDNAVHSPLVALKAILEFVSSPKVFILTVDTPFVSETTIQKLITQSNGYDVTVAKTLEKEHNLCGVFSKSILNTIYDMLLENNHKIGYLLKHVHSQFICCEDEKEFMNLNTQDEYKQALQRISLDNK